MTEPARPGSQSTSGRLLRFGAVGAVGFIVDGGLLYGLVASGLLGSLTARVVSFPTAVLTTWMLNRRFTFHDRGPAWPSLARYVFVSAIATSLNFAVYAGLILAFVQFERVPLAAFTVASGAAMAFNYVMSIRFAFKRGA